MRPATNREKHARRWLRWLKRIRRIDKLPPERVAAIRALILANIRPGSRPIRWLGRRLAIKTPVARYFDDIVLLED